MKDLLKKITVMVRDGSKKCLATVLMALTFLSPLSGVACAAPKGGMHRQPPHKVVQMSKHHGGQMHRAPVRHPAPRHEVHYRSGGHRHDEGAAIIGGLILGTIISAAINNANN